MTTTSFNLRRRINQETKRETFSVEPKDLLRFQESLALSNVDPAKYPELAELCEQKPDLVAAQSKVILPTKEGILISGIDSKVLNDVYSKTTDQDQLVQKYAFKPLYTSQFTERDRVPLPLAAGIAGNYVVLSYDTAAAKQIKFVVCGFCVDFHAYCVDPKFDFSGDISRDEFNAAMLKLKDIGQQMNLSLAERTDVSLYSSLFDFGYALSLFTEMSPEFRDAYCWYRSFTKMNPDNDHLLNYLSSQPKWESLTMKSMNAAMSENDSQQRYVTIIPTSDSTKSFTAAISIPASVNASKPARNWCLLRVNVQRALTNNYEHLFK